MKNKYIVVLLLFLFSFSNFDFFAQCNLTNTGTAAAVTYSNQQLFLGSGESRTLNLTAGQRVVFSSNTTSATNGMCFNGTQVGTSYTYIAPSTGNITIGMYRSNGWSSSSATLTYVRQNLEQSISFPQPSAVTLLNGMTINIAGFASATSGLPVAYSVISGPATLTGTTLSISGSGSVVLQASQAGDATYNSAVNVQQTLTVNAPVVPTVSTVIPSSANVGESVVITGTNFSSTPGNNIVYFGSVKATVTSASTTQLTVTVPPQSIAAPISVTVNGRTTQSKMSFFVKNSTLNNPSQDQFSFASPVSFTSSTPVYVVIGSDASDKIAAVGDLNLDGKSDIVKAGSALVSIHRNTATTGSISTSSFTSAQTVSVSQNPKSIAIADMDGDGKLDLISSGNTIISFLRNTTTANATSFTFSNDQNLTSAASSNMRVADIDGDGLLDIIVSSGASPQSFQVFLNKSTIGNISFLTSGASFSVSSILRRLEVSDVNSDGKKDVIVSTDATGVIFLNSSSLGAVSFTQTTNGPKGHNFAILDVDSDGDEDFVSANGNLYSNSSTFNTAIFTSISGVLSLDYSSFGAADYTGDGLPDFIFSGQSTYTTSELRTFQNNYSGSLSASTFSSLFWSTTDEMGEPIGCDFDGDNKIDILMTGSEIANFKIRRNTLGETVDFYPMTSYVNYLHQPYWWETSTGLTTSQVFTNPSYILNVNLVGGGNQYYNSSNGAWNVSSTFKFSTTTLDIWYAPLYHSGPVINSSSTGYFKTIGSTYGRPVSSNSTVFAVGKTTYNPITITNNTGSSDDYLVRVSDAVYKTGTSGTLALNSYQREWIVTKSNSNSGGTGTTITFDWTNSTSAINGTVTTPALFIYNTTTAKWEKYTTGVTTSGTTLTLAGYTGTLSGTKFAIGDNVTGFPYETITTSGTLTAFQRCSPNVSSTQTFTASGTNLQANISISAPTGIELSSNGGTSWGNPITLTQTSGSVSATTISVRMTTSAVTPSGNITLSSSGASNVTIPVSGTTANGVPVITPTSGYTCGTGAVSLSATATNTPTAYSYYTALTGGTQVSSANTYTTPSISSTTTYYIEATNACGTTNPRVAITASVYSAPSITSQSLAAQTLCENVSAAPLSVLASGSNLVYQWYENTSASNSGGNSITSATSASYTPPTSSVGTTYYYCTVSGTCPAPATSDVSGAIIVNSVPVVQISGTTTICNGSSTVLTASGASTYSWDNSAGSNAVATVSPLSSTTYTVIGTTNGCSSTANVTVTVNSLPSIISQATNGQSLCQNATANTLSVNATGTGLTYQWYENPIASASGGTSISGATSASYTPITSSAGTTYYYVVVSGTCSPSITSNVSGAIVVDNVLSGSISVPSGTSICTGSTKELVLSGHSGSIQWQSSPTLNGTYSDISGATSPTYTTGALTSSLYYRAVLSSGSCTPVYTSSQLITVDPLSVAGTISGTAGVCSGSTSSLSLTGHTGSVVWTASSSVNGTYSPIAGATSTSYTTAAITATTYYKVEVTSGTCPSVATAAYTVSTTPLGNIGAISGPSTATLGGTATYSVTAVTNATSYVWNLPAGMTLASNTNNGATITVSVANNFAGGTVTVQAVGCTNSAVVTRSVNAPSAATLSITTTSSGAPVFCGGTTASFSTTTTSTNNTATYAWTLPTGVSAASGSSLSGSSIDVVFAANYNGGTISVTRVSSTETLSASYSVGAIATPGVITGASSLCGASSGTYTIASVSGADSYEWSLPTGMSITSGTGTIMISTSWTGSIAGNVQVRAVKNSCGTSAWRTLSVASVATPGAITGPTTTCGANSNTISASGTNTTTLNTATYSISAVTGATGYTWTVPTGMAITSGQGTTSINVTITPSSFTSGSVTVVATTSTCTSAVRSLSISSANSTIVGPTDLCGLSQATYSINAPSGATVTWTLADWMSLASGQTLTSNPITVNIGAAPSQQNITASYSTSCGTATGSKFVGCNLFTQLESANCGATVDASQTVLANWVPNATNYRFTISGTGLSTPVVVTNSYRGFGWTQVSGYQLNATYSVKVALSFNGGTTFGSEGSTCTITPTAPTVTTSLESAYCGQSVAATQSVLATWVQGATSYRFTISGAGLSTPVVVTNNYRGFGWTQVPGYQLGTTYNVTVAIAFGGSTTFGNPGSSCTVTPTAPTVTTSLETAFCGQSVDASQTVLATWVQGATSYRFTISGAGLSTPVVVTNSYRGFGWNQVAGYQMGTTYTVTVALAFGGSTTFGNPGSSCTVTPTAPTVTTSLETAFCDQSVGASQTVLATWVQGATSYRFTISGAGLSTPVVVTNNYRGFGWTQVPGYQLGTSYTVTVALAFGGSTTFGNPGSSCTVTPTAPTVTTSLETAFCDQSVDASQTVLATWIQGATSYRFTISGAGLSTPVVVTNNYRGFGWTQVPGYQLGTSYTVTVAIAFGGSTTFGNPGSSCSVTPTAPTVTTSLETAFCGQSVAANQSVLATWIQGATSYRFTISGTGLANDVVVTNSWRGFSWASVPGYQLGSTYAVKVALAFGGSTTFGNDGTPCNVTLIAPQLTTQSCATQIYPSGGSSVITANTINGATGYQFTFTPTNGEPEIIYSTTNSIDMSLEGVADGSYTVTVAVAFGGTGLPSNMTYGAAGPGCNISFTNPTPLALQDPQLHEAQTEGIQLEEVTNATETTASIIEATSTSTWTATATSNPFAHSFQIKLNGAEGITTDTTFTAQLTDMSGKVYSLATLSKEQLEQESFGEQLAPGMYLMTLRQGEELRVIRVVKK